MTDSGEDPGRFGPSFRVRRVVVEPGGSLDGAGAGWRDAIVLLERGRIELVRSDGDRLAFRRGDVLWLDGLPVRAVHNPGREPAVLLAISRRSGSHRARASGNRPPRSDSFRGPRPS